MERLILKEGLGKSIEINGDCIKIKTSIFTGITTIPIKNIVQVTIKKPGFSGGHIYFKTFAEEKLSEMPTILGQEATVTIDGVKIALNNPHLFIFNGKKKYDIALKIKDYIETYYSKKSKLLNI